MSNVRNRLKVQGSIKDLVNFINDNYEKDIYHPSDGIYPSNLTLFFGKMFPTPDDILDNKINVYRWRMNNWGTPFLLDNEEYSNELIILYKHDFEYTPYSIGGSKFNSYVIRKVSEYSEMFYGENIHPDENELISEFFTTMTPPTKLITKWINAYKYKTLIFRLDYWDDDDRYVGNIHCDYKTGEYILEHHVKDIDLFSYVKYMIEEELKSIEDYAYEIAGLIIETNPEKSEKDYDYIYNAMVEEIELKPNLNEQVKFISILLNHLNNKKCNS